MGFIVAFVAVRQFLVSATPSQQQPLFVDVYVAGQNIPQGQAVTEAALSTITIPQDKVVQVMFTRDELPNLLNKVAKFPLDQGVVITESMVGDASSAGSTSFTQFMSFIPTPLSRPSYPIIMIFLSSIPVYISDTLMINPRH